MEDKATLVGKSVFVTTHGIGTVRRVDEDQRLTPFYALVRYVDGTLQWISESLVQEQRRRYETNLAQHVDMSVKTQQPGAPKDDEDEHPESTAKANAKLAKAKAKLRKR